MNRDQKKAAVEDCKGDENKLNRTEVEEMKGR